MGFYENECVSTLTKNCTSVMGTLSDYRNESSMGLVELRETEGTTSWGWTSVDEWLSYTVTVSTNNTIVSLNGVFREIFP